MRRKRASRDGAPSIIELVRRPVLILAGLIVILGANIGLAFVPLGAGLAANVLLALGSVVLIALFFMELEKEPALNRLFAASGVAWMAILFMLLFGDYFTRF